VSVVARPIKVSVEVGKVNVPVFTIVEKEGVVKVGLPEKTTLVEVVPVVPVAAFR
jgi:hypothetical protein